MSDFGERLRRLRRDRDVTQVELAAAIGVAPPAIVKYERSDNAYPSVAVLLRISNFFNVSTDFLLKGIEPNQNMENSISGQMLNSSIIQANASNGDVVLNHEKVASPEIAELVRIYNILGGRNRFRLLHLAMDLETEESEK